MDKNERPRERLFKYGVEALANYELLAIILRTGSKKKNVIDLSHEILKKYNLRQLSQANIKQLMKIDGIKEGKAAQILACFEIARRLETFPKQKKPKIRHPRDVYELLYPEYREKKQEYFIELCLDTKNHVIKKIVISKGTLDSSLVHPREVFRNALEESSSRIIVAHNHPSGDPTPSRDDIDVTKNLVKAGEIIGISVLDHIIIGDGEYVSMKDKGHI